MKIHLFWVLVLEVLDQFFIEPVNFSFFSISGWSIDLDYCVGNEPRHFVVFETAPKYCILDSFVDYKGYTISSKRFLPTVVDRIVLFS